VTCPATPLAPGDHRRTVQANGRERSYLLHVPRGYSGMEPVPVVFDFHGYGSDGAGQLGASGMEALSDEHGFIVVGPNGIGGSWHVNGCCGQAAQQQLDEISFVRAIVEALGALVCVDRKRIFATGISQGGGMAHHVGCLAADIFAAVAPVSSDLRTDPCQPSRPISELSVRGLSDTLSPYEGGPVGPPGMTYMAIGAKPTLERWKMIDQCAGTPDTSIPNCETYKECAAGVEVTLCSLPGAGHVLYQNGAGFDVAKTIWAMFERQPMR
jgi:polyhydroxybutyrate depolymerase